MSRVPLVLLLTTTSAYANNLPPDPTTQNTPDVCQALTVGQALLRKATLIAPLSTARATSRQPTFRWSSCAYARVEICADRLCTTVLQTVDVSGEKWTPSSDLSGNGNVYFWRITNLIGEHVGASSVVWEVNVPAKSAATSSVGGSALDYDLDGFADIAVGAYDAKVDSVKSGVVYVYGADGRDTATPVQTLTQKVPQSGALFGATLSNAGDLNGDGFGDLVVGANNAIDPDGDATGGAYVFYGTASGFDADATELFGSPDSAFGYSVSGAGDVDGDGLGDLLVGAPATNGLVGEAYLYYGRHGTTPALGKPGEVFNGSGAADGEFGVNVAGVGDLNGDGYADIAIGETYFNFWLNNVASGKVFVWYGGPNGLGQPVELVSPDSATSDGFGYAISDAGDLDHDGYFDLVVGASGSNGADGAVYVWYGGPAGITAGNPDLTVDPESLGQTGYFGHAVSAAGDLDGDGTDDLIVGETDVDGFTGALHVYWSSVGNPIQVATPDASFEYFGGQALILGDADGDDLADFAAGADGEAWYFGSTGALPDKSDAVALGPLTPGFGVLGR